jgi:hypothetical protein
MAGERGGRGLAALALLVSLIALGVSILAYQETRGEQALREQVRTLQGALETVRRETADALGRIERAIRPGEPSRDVTPDRKS